MKHMIKKKDMMKHVGKIDPKVCHGSGVFSREELFSGFRKTMEKFTNTEPDKENKTNTIHGARQNPNQGPGFYQADVLPDEDKKKK